MPMVTVHLRRQWMPQDVDAEVGLIRLTQRSTGVHLILDPADDGTTFNLSKGDELWVASNIPNAYTAWVSW